MSNRLRQVALRTAADVHANVSDIQSQRHIVGGTDQPLESGGGRGGHPVVLLAVDVEHRLLDVLQSDRSAAELKRAFEQPVPREKRARELGKGSTRLCRAVENPL